MQFTIYQAKQRAISSSWININPSGYTLYIRLYKKTKHLMGLELLTFTK